jgi:hypothetical protein
MTVTAPPPVSSTATSASTTSSAAATAATQSLSYNDFLALLMAELQNQDPTQPMDPSSPAQNIRSRNPGGRVEDKTGGVADQDCSPAACEKGRDRGRS